MENTKTAEEIAHQIVLAQLGGPKHIIEISVEALELYAAPLKKRIEELEAALKDCREIMTALNYPYTATNIDNILNPSTNGK